GALVCAICLGLHANVAGCRSRTLWTGAAARCHRDVENRLMNAHGQNVCLAWQLPRGCCSNARHIHECSGCGASNHRAAQCHL
ncbi:hypothetical protein DFH07DRAFT_687888, partial [Mycena maculata]